MANPKIQVRKDSYDIADNAGRSNASLAVNVPRDQGFEFRPQVRTAGPDFSIPDMVLEQGQSGDTPHGDDTFNMTHSMPESRSAT